jgi:hypothetical protein
MMVTRRVAGHTESRNQVRQRTGRPPVHLGDSGGNGGYDSTYGVDSTGAEWDDDGNSGNSYSFYDTDI